jgi:Fe-S oxidoreductase
MKKVFAPGCALILYKPELAEKLLTFLKNNFGEMDILQTCCRHEPDFKEKTEVINVCPGCDKRYRNNYENTTTTSLWEILAGSSSFPFPDYQGKTMTILDPCPVREREQAHTAVRELLRRMNINLIEPEKTRKNSICCGDSFYGLIPTEEVKKQMVKRTAEMPAGEVVVYCISCIKSVHIGGKTPHHLIDLLFSKETYPQTYDPDEWHKQLEDYINKH